MTETIDWDKVITAAEKFLGVVKERQDGLFTWNMMVGETWKNLKFELEGDAQ